MISHQPSVIRWSKVGFVEGNGTTNSSKTYSFVDNNIGSGKYSYRLKQIDRDGKRFELQVPFHDRDNLDNTLLELLDELYRVALSCECLLEASLHEPATDSTWN